MKNNNWFFVSIALFIILVASGVYLISKSRSNPPAETSAVKETPGLAVGRPVPIFSLRDRDGREFSSENLKGQNVVLFFTEGIMCYPSCWEQIAAFAEDSRFPAASTTVLSVVVDRKEDWQYAISKMPALSEALIVFDTDKNVSREFGMLTRPSSMHYGSFPGHSYVLIDKDGIVRYIFDDPMMAVNNDKLIQEIQKINPL
ncbi:MAG: redoxin domain-containing protein [Candidatus Sungbacteria bacterium]|nr:redoxin domain-containing protein [Candidatus Sungbacteria bacterium]